jgi:predicted outer membrane protein
VQVRHPVVPALIVAILALGTAGCGDLSRDELGRGVDTIDSIANEGAILAGHSAQDRSTVNFVRAQAEVLSDDAQHEQEKLHDSTVAPDLQDKLSQAILLAGDASEALDQLRESPLDAKQSGSAQALLERTAERAKRLGDEF